MLDKRALVKFALQSEPRHSVDKHSQNKTMVRALRFHSGNWGLVFLCFSRARGSSRLCCGTANSVGRKSMLDLVSHTQCTHPCSQRPKSCIANCRAMACCEKCPASRCDEEHWLRRSLGCNCVRLRQIRVPCISPCVLHI